MEQSSIADKVKETASITEVSDRLNVSRPSLYKYMDYYDRGDYDPIPPRVLAFFRMVDDGGDKDDMNRALLESSLRKDQARLRMMDHAEQPGGDRLSWTSDEVPTVLVQDRGGPAVIFRGAVAGGWDAAVRVSILIGDTTAEIARFEAEKGQGVVRIAGLPSGPRYQYTAELRRGAETRTSEPHQFLVR